MLKRTNKTFSEITEAYLSESSELIQFNILEDWDSTKILNIWKSLVLSEKTINNSSLFGMYVVANEDWWENISYKVYDTEQWWWILCLVNNVENPFEELEPGRKIKVLSKNVVYQLIKEAKYLANL